MRYQYQDFEKPAPSSALKDPKGFTQATKHTRIVDTAATRKARSRDGFCLYGLLHKDGCQGPLDGHHINEVGEGGDDVITNIISLCRWHHGLAQEHRISKEELFAILALYHGYKYPGIEPWTERFIKKISEAPRLWIHRAA